MDKRINNNLSSNFQDIINFIRELYNEPENFIPLHEPKFVGKEKEYVIDAIDSTFVSSVGAYVDRFEEEMAKNQHKLARFPVCSEQNGATFPAGHRQKQHSNLACGNYTLPGRGQIANHPLL